MKIGSGCPPAPVPPWDSSPVLATWIICSQNRHLQHDLTSPLLEEKQEMRVPSTRFALPSCSGDPPIFKKERFILCLVSSSPSNTWYVPAFIGCNMASCVGQDHRTPHCCLGRWPILPRGNPNVSPKMRSYDNNSSSYVGKSSDQRTGSQIGSSCCALREDDSDLEAGALHCATGDRASVASGPFPFVLETQVES